MKRNKIPSATLHYILIDPDIGSIEITHKRGIKNFNIRLRPFHNVQISAPHRASKTQILSLIEDKKNWIVKKQQTNNKIEKAKSIFDCNQQITLHQHTIKIIRGFTSKPQIKGNAPNLTIEIPENYDTNTPAFQEQVRGLIVYILKLEAKKHLPKRIAELAATHNFKYSKLTLRNNKTNWGSCSGSGNISLNIQLMRLPERYIDYVIVHELCHTIHHNHGPNFKRLLSSIIPDAAFIEKEMKKYRTQIF